MGSTACKTYILYFATLGQHDSRELWVANRISTLETSPDKPEGKYHTHLMLQFCSRVCRNTKGFCFEGILPNVSSNDLCGDGLGGKRPQVSVNRGMFYAYADKIGTARDEEGKPCVDGNYYPAWEDGRQHYKYQVLGRWPETLWKQRKLTHAMYEEYLFLCRDGVLPRIGAGEVGQPFSAHARDVFSLKREVQQRRKLKTRKETRTRTAQGQRGTRVGRGRGGGRRRRHAPGLHRDSGGHE